MKHCFTSIIKYALQSGLAAFNYLKDILLDIVYNSKQL